MRPLKLALLGLFLGLSQTAAAACWWETIGYKTVCSDCQTCNWNPQPCIEIPIKRYICDDQTRGAAKPDKAQAAMEQAHKQAEAAHQDALLALEKALGLLAADKPGTAQERKAIAAEAKRLMALDREAQLKASKAVSAHRLSASPFGAALTRQSQAASPTAQPLDGNCSGGLTCARKGAFSVCCPEGFPYYSGCDQLCHRKKPWDCGDVSACKP
jgi:hypothetical protein